MINLQGRPALLLAVCGTAACLAAGAKAQVVINQSGATLLENFLKAPAASNDYFDVDGDGFARVFSTNDQLAPFALPPAPGFGQNLQHWIIQYRAVGSVNGFQELVDFGTTFVTTADNVDIFSSKASKSFHNRTQFINNQVASNAIFNAGNPGGAPVRSDTTTLQATYDVPPNASAGGIRIDMAPVDVPAAWAVFKAGTPAYNKLPATGGYGFNGIISLNKTGGTSGAGLSHKLANLGPRNLFDPNNPGAADSNTIFDVPIAWAPIATVTNLGTGIQEIDKSDMRHLLVTGRSKKGENLMVVTRDSGSGTRNGYNNTLCLDPSWGMGENIGPLSAIANQNILGDEFIPSNKNGNGEVETTTTNHRLGIGYAGAERGINSGWLSGGRLECVAVRNDDVGGALYARPHIDNVLDNGVDGYRLGGPAIFATIGDPQAAPASKGGTSNGLPPMPSIEAAAYLNNVTLSIAAFAATPGGSATLFTPGEFLATNFILTAALDFVPTATDPCNFVANSTYNAFLQTYTRANNVLKNPAYQTFGTFTLNGVVPTRKTGVTYTDGVVNGLNYKDQSGAPYNYGTPLNNRNRICGDFNNDQLRNLDDAYEMVDAFVNPVSWQSGTDAIREVLGDFNGDGNFDINDLWYWGDGLGVDPACGNCVNRLKAFRALDDNFGGNLFGTTQAHGSYASGISAADVAGSGGWTPGFAPIGHDGHVDGGDIDYVYRQFRQNANVSDGQLNWDNLDEAQSSDFSCDINGDGFIDQKDVCFILTMLETTFGDVDLDGDVDAADRAKIAGNVTSAGGWADGDIDGDGVVTSFDLDAWDLYNATGISPCCPSDFDSNGFVNGDDFDAFVGLFEAGDCAADFDLNGFVNGDDFDSFVVLFASGC